MFKKLLQPSFLVFLAFLPIAAAIGFIPSMGNTPKSNTYFPLDYAITQTDPLGDSELKTPLPYGTYQINVRYDDVWPNRITELDIEIAEPLEIEYGRSYIMIFEAPDPIKELLNPQF